MNRSPSSQSNSTPTKRAHFRSSTKHIRRTFSGLDAYFGNLERLADVAFDNTLNTDLRLYASVGFAEAVGVPDRLILHTTDELDRFLEE